MTGAPIQNRLSELWSLFALFPGARDASVFQGSSRCRSRWAGTSTRPGPGRRRRCATSLRSHLAKPSLRRMADVNVNLPAKTERFCFCPMTLSSASVPRVPQQPRGGHPRGRREALGGIDVLRKIVNHPDLLERTTRAAAANYGSPIGRETSCARCWGCGGAGPPVLGLLADAADAGHPGGLGRERGVRVQAHGRLDAGEPADAPHRRVQRERRVFALLLTTKTGGLGVNSRRRPGAVRPDWNPSTDAQAERRGGSGGKEVTVYRLVTAGTIEEKVYHRRCQGVPTSKVLKDPSSGASSRRRTPRISSRGRGRPGGAEGGGGTTPSKPRSCSRTWRARSKPRTCETTKRRIPRDPPKRTVPPTRTRRGRRRRFSRRRPDGDDAWDPNADPGRDPRGGRAAPRVERLLLLRRRRLRSRPFQTEWPRPRPPERLRRRGDHAPPLPAAAAGGASGPAGPNPPSDQGRDEPRRDHVRRRAGGPPGCGSPERRGGRRARRGGRGSRSASSARWRGAARLAPTWTARGDCGRRSRGFPHAGRFGRAAMGSAEQDASVKSSRRGGRRALNGGAPRVGALLRRIRARGGGGGAGTPPRGGASGRGRGRGRRRRGGVDAPRRVRVSRGAAGASRPTGLVVDAFQDRVGAGRGGCSAGFERRGDTRAGRRTAGGGGDVDAQAGFAQG